MIWEVKVHEDFWKDIKHLHEKVTKKLDLALEQLKMAGPNLSRLLIDTLKGSMYSSLKGLRIDIFEGNWRFAFVFDPMRRAVILVAGNKAGVNKRLFYSKFVSVAERRYTNYLETEL